jgi:hypothetical protein
MSLSQIFAATPWSLGVVKLILAVALLMESSTLLEQMRHLYQSGPGGQVGLAIAFGLFIPICLNGVYEGFDRGNWLGLAGGGIGLAFTGKAFIFLFAPQYLGLLPF